MVNEVSGVYKLCIFWSTSVGSAEYLCCWPDSTVHSFSFYQHIRCCLNFKLVWEWSVHSPVNQKRKPYFFQKCGGWVTCLGPLAFNGMQKCAAERLQVPPRISSENILLWFLLFLFFVNSAFFNTVENQAGRETDNWWETYQPRVKERRLSQSSDTLFFFLV